MEQLYWIDVGYACFGIIEKDGIVIETAPISKWAKGKDIDYVINYYKRKRAKVIKV